MSRRYLNLISLTDALAAMRRAFPPLNRIETIPLRLAVDRVTAEPLYAKYSIPQADMATFDGYAVKSEDTLQAQDQRPLPLENSAPINTGEILPKPYDAVVMIEDTWDEEGIPWIRSSVSPRQHVRHVGEDIKAGELVLPKGHPIRPFDIGALATYGITRLRVRSVRIGIVPTGSDLVPLGISPEPGQTIETNTLMAEAYLTRMGATCRRYGIVPDDPNMIQSAFERAAAENDIVILSAGSSAGSRDYTSEVISEIGEVIFHGIAIRPGKPVLLAHVDGKPVFGMPGYPVAAQTILREIVGDLLCWWGLSPESSEELGVQMSRKVTSDVGFDEFIQISVGRVGDTFWATPHPRGGGIQMAVVRANGYLHIPAGREGLGAGEEVRIRLTVPAERITRTLICTGVRHSALNELGNSLSDVGYMLHCCNASTMGAVLALQAETCHAASICIPDTEEAWNDQVLRYLPEIDLMRVPMTRTELGIASADDLDVSDLGSLRFINRQKSSVARTLLDAWLGEQEIDTDQISGYEHEVRTSDAIVTAVVGGFADAGVCPVSVARDAGLSVISLGYESCELLIREEYAEGEGVASLIQVAQSPAFRERLKSFEDYRADRAGRSDGI